MRASCRRHLAALAVLLCSPAAWALHQDSPAVLRLTDGPPHELGPGRAWGNRVVFASTQDLAGLGATRVAGSQIFEFNLATYDCEHGLALPTTPCPPAGTPWLVQVTNGPGDPDHPSLAAIPSPPAPADQWVAFDAAGAYGGLTGAAAARRQLFLKNLRTGEVRTVTSAADGDSTRPSVSRLAGIVTFESTAALGGFPNPAGVSQVYVYERGSNLVQRISIGPGPASVVGLGASTDATPNELGTGIAFASRADLLGTGADTGRFQVFHAAYDPSTHASTLTQVTAGNGPSRHPFLGDGPGGGKVLVFESTATDLPGALGTPGSQLYEVAAPPATPLPDVAHLTTADVMGDCFTPAIDPSGTRLVFVCAGDPLQNGTTGRRLFALDRPSLTLYQLTGLGSVDGPVSAHLGEWFAAFATTSDLTSSGSCTRQLYIVDFFAGRWPAATLLGQAPGDVFAPNACATPCTTSAQCDDGNACNGSETCGGDGRCHPGTPVVCSNGNACDGFETCNPATGTCVPGAPPACNDGNPCNGTETCNPAAGCQPGVPVACSDGNACNGMETCNPATGTCQPGAPMTCNDGNPCTSDSCVPASGCNFTANTNPCDDGDACTTSDACAGGQCSGTPVVCGTCETCDPASGACAAGPAPACTGPVLGFRGQLLLKDGAAGDLLVWKWLGGGATDASEFGSPAISTGYAFCLYDAANQLVLGAAAPAGGTCAGKVCWRPTGLRGWRYVDPDRTPDGIAKLLLTAGPSGKARATLKAKGQTLAVPPPGTLVLPLRTQLRADTGACWEVQFPESSVLRQDAGVLKARR